MFALLTSLRRDLRQFSETLDLGTVSPIEAQAAIESLARVEKLAAGARLRLTACLDVSGDRGEKKATDWLAAQTGQTPTQAAKDLDTARHLDGLDATDQALRNGELSVDQAREVVSGASADPSAEDELLATARNASVQELRRKAKSVRAAATDDEKKNRRAHRNRSITSGNDPDSGEAWFNTRGPAAAIAQMLAYLEPWVQAQFKKARDEDRRETRGALMFDAILAALKAASSGRGSGAPAPVQIIARVDIPALLRGRTIAGETCDIEGIGPVPVQALVELLPQAAIDLIVTKGEDTFNVTHLGRQTTARQKTVLHWLGVECARQGCSCTRNLQIDHRIDWAKTHLTQLKALDFLCPGDHRRKTVEGWALVHGRGKRQMVPPDDPRHPSNCPPDQTEAQAAA